MICENFRRPPLTADSSDSPTSCRSNPFPASRAHSSPLPRSGRHVPQAVLAAAGPSRGGGRQTRSRRRTWSRMRLISPGSVMKPTNRISPPHRGHTRGSTSYTLRIRFAHRRLRAARTSPCSRGGQRHGCGRRRWWDHTPVKPSTAAAGRQRLFRRLVSEAAAPTRGSLTVPRAPAHSPDRFVDSSPHGRVTWRADAGPT